jgi:hypothetical protein
MVPTTPEALTAVPNESVLGKRSRFKSFSPIYGPVTDPGSKRLWLRPLAISNLREALEEGDWTD